MGKKFCFGPKNVEKTGFSGFSEITSEKRFANLLYCSDWAQTYRVADSLIVEGAQLIKVTTLVGKKSVLGQKTSKKRVFKGFPKLLQENGSQICCIGLTGLKLTG